MSSTFHKFGLIAAWSLLAFIAYATVAPIQDRPSLPASPSFEHVAAFVALGIAFCFAYPRQTLFAGLIVVGSAVLLEIFQLITPDRHGRVQDAVEKVAGGTLGIMIGWLVLWIGGRWLRDRCT
jgi:VanZ family protein